MPGLQTARDPDHGDTNYQSFWIVLPDDFPSSRDELLGAMDAAGISCRRGIMATHLEQAFIHLPPAELPNTERLAASSLILPLFHAMTDDDQRSVANVVRRHAGMSFV